MDSPPIHMDVDRSFLPLPSAVKASIFESFARQNMAEHETDVRSGIQKLLMNSYGISIDNSSELILGNSSQALFIKLLLCCIQESGTFLFPSGTNGYYLSAAKFLKANLLIIPTQLETGFKLDPTALESFLSAVSNPWVYISGPTIMPTGLLYRNTEINEILSVCARFGTRVVIDTSFSGLEFITEDWDGWNLQTCLSKLPASSSFSLSLLGGLSFEMLTGGLEFGFLILNDPHLIETVYSFPSLNKPHSTVRYAIKRLLGLKEQKAQQLMDTIAEHKQILRSRSHLLAEMLSKCGWDVISSRGGVSMVAKPSAYLGKTVKISGFESKLDGSNIREAVLRTTGLCINSSSWTGIPDYCRFSFGLEATEFERSLECISHFANLVLQI
ncbi:Methionine S-methyltransferase [Apostasia shenzhenica]|uniref:Methionine S-methyltransferase n=1 Tax=Apostasia shenzhenica TaxID=1088818 RepID=A0A2I0AMC4_9ASPA|nr:Methionine S-methyltransferase [Apostasia shenzhenica]